MKMVIVLTAMNGQARRIYIKDENVKTNANVNQKLIKRILSYWGTNAWFSNRGESICER